MRSEEYLKSGNVGKNLGTWLRRRGNFSGRWAITEQSVSCFNSDRTQMPKRTIPYSPKSHRNMAVSRKMGVGLFSCVGSNSRLVPRLQKQMNGALRVPAPGIQGSMDLGSRLMVETWSRLYPTCEGGVLVG